jgi:hypothetical protein
MTRGRLRPDHLRPGLLQPDLARNHRVEGRRSGPLWACRWRRASLSRPWFRSRPMAGGPSWLSPVGRRSSFQRHHCRRKIRQPPRNPPRRSFKWPRPRPRHRKQRPHHRKQRPCPRPHRQTPHQRHPQRCPIRLSCCKRWRAISRICSETSNSSRRTSSRWPATIQRPLRSSRRARKKSNACSRGFPSQTCRRRRRLRRHRPRPRAGLSERFRRRRQERGLDPHRGSGCTMMDGSPNVPAPAGAAARRSVMCRSQNATALRRRATGRADCCRRTRGSRRVPRPSPHCSRSGLSGKDRA